MFQRAAVSRAEDGQVRDVAILNFESTDLTKQNVPRKKGLEPPGLPWALERGSGGNHVSPGPF